MKILLTPDQESTLWHFMDKVLTPKGSAYYCFPYILRIEGDGTVDRIPIDKIPDELKGMLALKKIIEIEPEEHWKNISLDPISEVHDGNLCIEIWKPIKGYEGLYEISSFGRVKNIERLVKGGGGGFMKKETRILTQVFDKNKYLEVYLCKESVKTTAMKVDRLVAENFIDRTFKKSVINHIKGIKWDNRVHQLELVSRKNKK